MDSISLNKQMIKKEEILLKIALGSIITVLIVTTLWLIVRLVRGA